MERERAAGLSVPLGLGLPNQAINPSFVASSLATTTNHPSIQSFSPFSAKLTPQKRALRRPPFHLRPPQFFGKQLSLHTPPPQALTISGRLVLCVFEQGDDQFYSILDLLSTFHGILRRTICTSPASPFSPCYGTRVRYKTSFHGPQITRMEHLCQPRWPLIRKSFIRFLLQKTLKCCQRTPSSSPSHTANSPYSSSPSQPLRSLRWHAKLNLSQPHL